MMLKRKNQFIYMILFTGVSINEQCSKPLLVDDQFGDYTYTTQYIEDWNYPRTGNPILPQPGFNGMILWDFVATAHLQKSFQNQEMNHISGSSSIPQITVFLQVVEIKNSQSWPEKVGIEAAIRSSQNGDFMGRLLSVNHGESLEQWLLTPC